MTLEEILQAQKPSDLFNLDEDIHNQYKKLAKFCHPDINKNSLAEKAFKHLVTIYDIYKDPSKALKESKQIDFLILIEKDKKYKYIPRVFNKDECGEIYLGNSTLRLFNNKLLLDNHEVQFYDFLYKSKTTNFDKYVSETHYIKYNDQSGILYKHQQETYRLKEILIKLKSLPQEHVIWITNRLLELAAYLESINIVHNNISLFSVYINPNTHGIELCDWQYARKTNEKLIALNGSLETIFPKETLKTGKAINQTDLNLIKHLGIQLLGDSSGFGNKLKMNKSINQNILRWYQGANKNKNILETYDKFRKLCEKELGKSKFFKLELNNIY